MLKIQAHLKCGFAEVRRATIIPRGRALGMVMQLPEGDRHSMNFTQMTSRLARAMVTRWDYSDELGLVSYGREPGRVFLNHSVSRQQNVSEETAQKIGKSSDCLTRLRPEGNDPD
jgi:cell division protease FtsH